MKIYELKQEFNTISEMLENEALEVDEETGEIIADNTELLQELLSGLEDEKESKVDSLCYLIREAKQDEALLASEIKRLQERKKMFERKQDKLKELLSWLLNGEKIKTVHNTVSFRNSTSVKILDGSKIPSEFLKIKTVATVNKKAISEKLKADKVVAGAELEVKKSLSIR